MKRVVTVDPDDVARNVALTDEYSHYFYGQDVFVVQSRWGGEIWEEEFPEGKWKEMMEDRAREGEGVEEVRATKEYVVSGLDGKKDKAVTEFEVRLAEDTWTWRMEQAWGDAWPLALALFGMLTGAILYAVAGVL